MFFFLSGLLAFPSNFSTICLKSSYALFSAEVILITKTPSLIAVGFEVHQISLFSIEHRTIGETEILYTENIVTLYLVLLRIVS